MIKGFWHVCLVNHWYSIVVEQMRLLLTSGLYGACESINIGCVGDIAERVLFEEYIVACYSKLKLCFWSADPKNYEFPTLQLIEKDSGDYVGFYFHTKGVTKPGDTMANHWRTVLEEATLHQWKKHWLNVVSNLYDISSINFLTAPKHPDHFSGNFWWFRRDYINRLPQISTLDRRNRYWAEQWICMSKEKRLYSSPFKEPRICIINLKDGKSIDNKL